MNVYKATGLDNLPAKLIKDSPSLVVFPQTHVINLSLRDGIIPDELKMARVVLLHKKMSMTCQR